MCVCVWLPFINASHQNLARVLATHAFACAHRFHPPVGAIIYYRGANIKDCGKDGEREGSPLAKSALRNQLVQASSRRELPCHCRGFYNPILIQHSCFLFPSRTTVKVRHFRTLRCIINRRVGKGYKQSAGLYTWLAHTRKLQ